MKVFVTGSAGFIGFHLCRRLLADGHMVTGYDGLTDYYDPVLKQRRLDLLRGRNGFAEVRGMLEDRALLAEAVRNAAPEVIVHLAAQAGVRYSVEHPEAYIDSNITGTFHLLEAAREVGVRHLLLASTSSVYGGNQDVPYRETDAADWPVSLYAATKKANEAMSHSYAHLFDIPTTCFRFFTVYGPWGRPDMSLYKFVGAIEKGEPIEIYGEGRMQRDFTYIDDLVEGIVRLIGVPPRANNPVAVAGGADSLSPVAPWRVVNIGGGQPIDLLDYVAAIEEALEKSAEKRLLPMQAGDVRNTYAAPDLLRALTGFVPSTPIGEGVRRFVAWYRDYAGRD
ncbi:MAG TPA: NAD-dependent epimerase/dehydratase family protein [Alphaproteobacteria bacterium]|nr:NAD-dependent epimerase/dehydratase family protein [Alphaproteobacteria bacterium]